MSTQELDHKPLDPGRVNPADPLELRYWCIDLRCTEADLKDAIASVGEHVARSGNFSLRVPEGSPRHQSRAFRSPDLGTDWAITNKINAFLSPLDRKVHAVGNYEGFVVDRDVEDAWAESVCETVSRWYDGVTRYTTSAFLRAKLGAALSRRKIAPRVFETEMEARAALSSASAPRSAGQTAS